MREYKWICTFQYFTGWSIFETCHFDFVRAMTEEDLEDKVNAERIKHRNLQVLVWAKMEEVEKAGR